MTSWAILGFIEPPEMTLQLYKILKNYFQRLSLIVYWQLSKV